MITKRDLIVAIASVSIALFGNYFYDFSNDPIEIKSERKKYLEVKKFMDDYTDNSNKKKLKVDIVESGNKKMTLKGFTFNVADIEEIIHDNYGIKKPFLGKREKPDSLIFYLGKESEFNDEDSAGKNDKQPHMRLIAFGAKKVEIRPDSVVYKLLNKNFDNPNDLVNVSIYDKASPCPTSCPN